MNNTNVIPMPASAHFTPEQALASAQQIELSDVFVAGFNTDGHLVTRSSTMTRAEALWLVKQVEHWIMEGCLP